MILVQLGSKNCHLQQKYINMQNSQNCLFKFEKYMRPSGCCQACLSQTQLPKDCIITCRTCKSCIHQTHYGSELAQPSENWDCERCRYFKENGTSDIQCQFCPSLRGIMKQYLFQNRKIWLHPECAVWGYPIIFFASSKKEGIRKQKPKSDSTYYWIKDYEPNQYPCQVCHGLDGYLIKCKYYSCTKSYHATCARPHGIIRDLESMRIESGAGYFPVYCKQHIELKIEDCKKRVKLLRERGQLEKAAHFHKIGNLFTEQLKNLEVAVLKCKQEEEMIKKLSIETLKNFQGNQNASFSELDNSFSSSLSNQYLQMLQSEMIDESLALKPIEEIKIFREEHVPIKLPPPPPPKPIYVEPKPQKSNRPIHHKAKPHNKENPKDLTPFVIQISQMDIEHPKTLPPVPPPANNNRSQSEPSGDEQHKVNSYEMMFDNF